MDSPKKNYIKINAKTPELKDFLDKAYTLDHSENYEVFLQELGIRKNTRVKAINSKPTIVLSQVNDEYVLSTNYPEGRHIKFKFKIGEEIQRRPSSKYASSVFRVADNKLIEEQCFDDKIVVIVREFRNKELLVTMEVNNVQCHRWYTEASSKYSVGTETSRKFSIWEKESHIEMELEDPKKEEEEEKAGSQEEETDDEKLCY